MIKFERYYDGFQNKIQAISTEETKNNGNIDCCYTISKYIKEEIEDLQTQLQQKENIIKEVREYITTLAITEYGEIDIDIVFDKFIFMLDKGE